MVAIVSGSGLGFQRSSASVLGMAGMLGQSSLGRGGDNVMVNAATGNLMIERRDEFLVGRGPDAYYGQTYNSQGDVSNSWAQSVYHALGSIPASPNTAGSTITRGDGDGRITTYTYDSARGAYVTTEGGGAHDELRYANGAWTWTDGDSRTTETYTALSGVPGYLFLASVTDADGNAQTYTWNTNGTLSRITNANGDYVQFTMNGNGLPSQITTYASGGTALQTRTRYVWDSLRRLTSVTVDLSPGDHSVADGKSYTNTYTYDGTSTRITSVTQTDGSRLDISYVLTGSQYRVATLTQTVATGVTRTTSFSYDTVNRTTSVTDAAGAVTTLRYDAAGNLTEIVSPVPAPNTAAPVTTFTYTATGDVASVTQGGRTTVYSYDSNGNMVLSRDSAGTTVTRTYGSKNELLTSTQYLVADPDGAGAGAASSPVTTRYAYDSENHLRFTVTAEGRVTEYRYDAVGNPISVLSYTANSYSVSGLAASTAIAESTLASWAAAVTDKTTIERVDTTYDLRGNVATVTAYSKTLTDGSGDLASTYSRTTYAYDAFGRLLSRQETGRSAETFLYDGFSRMISSTDTSGAVATFTFNDAATTTSVTLAGGLTRVSVYNKAGELISLTESGSDIATATTNRTYDSLGRLRKETDPSGRSTYFVYDSLDRKIADVTGDGAMTEYSYDSGHRLVRSIAYVNRLSASQIALLTGAGGTDPLNGLRPTASALDLWTWNIYDNADRLIETIDSAGRATVYSYDGASRLVSTTAYATAFDASMISFFKSGTPAVPYLPATNAATDRRVRTFYDNEGRLVGTLDGAGGLSQIFYDSAGRKIREIAYANPVASSLTATGTFAQLLASAGTSASDRRGDNVYDRRGLLRYTIDAAGHPTEFIYDSAGQVIRTVDYAGAIATSASYSMTYVQGQITTLGLAANAATRTTRNVYDTAGRLAFRIDAEGAASAYAYDQAGNLVKTTRYATLFTAAGDQSLAAMQSWASGQSGAAGNRVTRQIFDSARRLAFLVDAEGFVTEHRYDSAGRLSQAIRYPSAYSVADGATKSSLATQIGAVPAAAVVTSYAYDSAGRLTDLTDGTGAVTRYVYDALGQITDETAAFGTTDAVTVRRVFDAAGRVVSETGAYGTAQAATTSFSYDALGNVLTVTDARGSVTSRTYDVLGNVLTLTAPIDASTNAVVTHVYDRFSNVVKTTDARGNSTYNYYDKLGRVVAIRDAENYVTETAYTVFGDIASVTRRYNPATNAAAIGVLPTYVAHAKDATTTFLYDRLGRATKATDAEGHYEQYWHDAFGQRTSARNKLGGITTSTFDKRGLLLTETLPMASYDKWGNVVSSTVTNRFEYDSRGNRTRLTEAYGLPEQRITNYVYDKQDRLTEIQHNPVSVLSQTDHSTTSTVTPIEYRKFDRLGRLVETVDMLGARTLFFYDKLHRKTAELAQTAAGGPGTLSTYTYDGNGNLLTSRIYGTQVAIPATPGGTAPAGSGEYRETTYTYDKLNRVKTTNVANVRTGAWNGSYFAITTGTVTTSFDYDANGNVIKATNANGAASYSFYDRLNRRVASVDQENYLTAYTLNGDGNVVEEARLANKVTAAFTTATDPVWLRSTVAASGADRITQFVYDRNGRRTSETRLNVNSSTVGGTGALGSGSAHSAIAYAYNGMGQVTQKTAGNGEVTSYTYDSMGRLTQESRPQFTDFNGALVRPTTVYFYDGLNNLSVTRQGGLAAAGADRYTRYTYGAGGRMTQMTDASGQSYNYFHDAAGNVVRESYNRVKSDGTTVTEGLLYTRDVLGRVTSQSLAAWNGSAWVKGDIEQVGYNAYGDVSQRGVNGLWQEQFAYDGAGRMWRSNARDGVWRFYVHDGNGNETLTLESEGTNLAGYTLDQAIALATSNGAHYVGGGYVDGINATISVFDKRGLAVQTRTPKRQLNATAAAVDIASSRTYNAFGEVASETDARGFTTDFVYNTMGRLTQKLSPLVSSTAENGTTSSVRPTENFYYDAAGRMIGSRDANNNLTTRHLLAGSGHGSEPLVTYEFHADGGVVRNDYDVYGDRRISWDEINRRTDMAYDAMGRVTQISHPNGLIDYFGYDLLGQKTSHWNNVLQVPVYGPPQQVWVEEGYWDPYYGWVDTSHWETQTPIIGYTPDKELTDYDLQGRVTRYVAFGGDTTTTSYSWSSSLATSGMATYGGWTQTTTYANSRSSTEQTDMFGRLLSKTDLGGHNFTFGYDAAGRMTQKGGAESVTYSYLNTGLLASTSTGWGGGYGTDYDLTKTVYGYDAAGNKTSEVYTKEGGYWQEYYDPYYGWPTYSEYITYNHVYQNATAAYDALGRMTSWAETGNATAPAANIQYQYDAAGNVRRSNAQYRTLDANGNASGTVSTQDNWYRYDSMNRVVTAQGSLSGGQIVRGYTGTDFTYDAAGQRKSATSTTLETAWIYDPWSWDPYYGSTQMPVSYDHVRREDYSYDGAGNLDTVRIAETTWSDNGDGTITTTPPPATGELKGDYTFDQMGRLTRQIDYLYGTTVGYDRTVTYNGKSQVQSETTVTRQGADVHTSYISNDFGSGTNYALGAIVYTSASNYKNNVYQNYTSTSTTYAWWDGAVQSQVTTTQGTSATSYYYYDAGGRLSSISVGGARAHSITFTNDMNGQAIRRDESDYVYNQGDPHEVWYRFNGKQLGYTGNDGTLDTDYQTSIGNRTRTPGSGAFRFGATWSSAHADFDLSLESINSYNQGGAGGSYTVKAGETLQSIAAQLWGDSSLWFRLAEANGMSAANALGEGQRLIVPTGVMKSQHNASTFKPYDPSEVLGDTSPTTPQPQTRTAKKNKCGIFGQILLVVIAVAVSVVTYGALTGPATGLLGSIAAGAVSGAAGSIASQAFGVATGIQDKFSWKGVAMAAIGGAVGGGLGKVGGFLGADKFVSQVAKGALSSALTQGIGVVTGLQHKFDWVGVGAAGLGAGVSGAVARGLGVSPTHMATGTVARNATYYASHALSGMAGAIANAATRSVLEGSDFGDNIIAALPDVIGSTIGNMIADPIVQKIQDNRAQAAAQQAQAEAQQRSEAMLDRIPEELQRELLENNITLTPTPEGIVVEGGTVESIARILRVIRDRPPAVQAPGVRPPPTVVATFADPLIRFFPENTYFLDTGIASWQVAAGMARDDVIGDNIGITFRVDYDVQMTLNSIGVGYSDGRAIRFIAVTSGAGAGRVFVYSGNDGEVPGLGLTITYGQRRPPEPVPPGSVAESWVDRNGWGARTPNYAGMTPFSGVYNTITLHHTGDHPTPQSVESLHRDYSLLRDIGDAIGVAQEYNYADVGYNYMIGEDGRIYEGRPLDYEGAHVGGNNPGNIGIAMLGDYSNRPMTAEQARSLDALMRMLRSQHPITTVKTHGQFDAVKINELGGARNQINQYLTTPLPPRPQPRPVPMPPPPRY